MTDYPPHAAWQIADDGPLPVDDPLATAGAGDVVLEIEAAWLAGAANRPGVVAGGAAVGRVVDAGDQARALVGSRALVGPHVPCGDCEVCRRGGAPVCPRGATLGVDRRGTLAARVVVPSRWVVAFDAALDVPGPAAAAIGGDVAIAYALYVRSSIGPREPAVIVGDDAVARFLHQVLVGKGVTPVVVAGADTAAAAIDAGGFGERPRRVFATTRLARELAVDVAGPRGVVVARAHPDDAGPLTLGARALADEVTLHAVVGAHPDLLTETAAMVSRGDVSLAETVSVVALRDLPAATKAPPAGRSLVVTLDV